MAAQGLFTVARVEDVPPGTVVGVEAGGEAIALANVEGDFYALQGHCLHLEGPLGEGRLDAEHYLTCPWHGWKYNVATGKNDFDLAIQARTYEVTVEDGEIKVAVG
jgi:nitrite reductase/ring-hydroxylating ferredoxin subunit